MYNSCCYWESANRNIRYLDVLPLFKQAVNTMMSCTKHVLKMLVGTQSLAAILVPIVFSRLCFFGVGGGPLET